MLHSRKLAHAQVRRRERQGAEKAAQQPKRSWVGWALGYKAPTGEEAAAEEEGATAEEGGGEGGAGKESERSHLTATEVQALEDMVQTQVRLQPAGASLPVFAGL